MRNLSNYTYSLSGLKDNTTYYYCAYFSVDGQYTYGDVRSFTTEKKKDEITPGQMVDLGLSVKWAGWNVGASRPEEYGGYYAWGELEEKSYYDYDNYQYTDSNGEFIYIGNNISGTIYDVAHVKWGGSWRIPTLTEVQELMDKCHWEEVTYRNISGQKVVGPNGNSIFLPYDKLWPNMSSGYWLSNLEENFGYDAYVLLISGVNDVRTRNRINGFFIRPVSE